ncbi:MAG TPA: flagellar basal body rod protein FlgB [Gammaproteobacteria bacterium]|nr:flagellar basal body rod protein FlgB [Gammaproteobacteria bacterium]
MAIGLDKLLGDLPTHLTLYGQRSRVLATNLANADTPGYKARDIDFRSLLSRAAGEQLTLKTTRSGHIRAASGASRPELMYRNPTQPSLDGNTVDAQLDKARFTENAVRYQATLRFLEGKFKGLRLAIKGE